MFYCGITWSSPMRGRIDLPHDVEAYQLHLEPRPLQHGGTVKAKLTITKYLKESPERPSLHLKTVGRY
jgi:hypothetical protein